MFLEDAALACGVPYERLRKAVQRGGLPAEKLRAGRTTPYVVKLDDVRAYLATVRRGPKKKAARTSPAP
jgi:hypothetical protein